MEQAGQVRGLLLIAAVGVSLGLVYNAVGLHMTGTWGLAWLGEPEQIEAVSDGATAANGVSTSGYVSDDPMAIPSAAPNPGLPEIPDLGRPIQMQLPVVKKFFDEEAALFVDARDVEDFAAGHIPGALNLPFDEVITDPVRLAEVDSGGRPIITYCSGGSCEASTNLAWELINGGHSRVLVFHGGMPAWEEADFPVAGGDTTPAGRGVPIAWFAASLAVLALVIGGLAGRGPAMQRLHRLLHRPIVVRLASLVIGAILGLAGMAKIGDPASFARQIGNFHMTPAVSENLLAVTLPWVELVVALALFLGIRRRAGGILSAILMAVFTVAVAQAAARGFDVECGCFGTADSATVGLSKLAENVAMLSVAIVAAVRPR